MKRLISCVGALTIALFTTHVSAIPFSDLVNGTDVLVGDKLFANFTVLNSETCPGSSEDPTSGCTSDDINLADIEVTGVGDGTFGNEYGLNFASNNGALFQQGDSFLDLWFGFSVDVVGSDQVIVGSSMNFDAIVAGGAGLALIEKDIYTSDQASYLNFMEVYIDPFDVPVVQGSDSASFAGQNSIWVEDNIFVDGFGGHAEVTNFTQRFVQGEVPVPAPFALLGLGLVALGWSRRR